MSTLNRIYRTDGWYRTDEDTFVKVDGTRMSEYDSTGELMSTGGGWSPEAVLELVRSSERLGVDSPIEPKCFGRPI